MPIAYPPETNSNNDANPGSNHPSAVASPSKSPSDFVSCEGLTFRLADMDGFLFQPQKNPELKPATVVFFAGRAIRVTDPEKRLYDLLTAKLKPCPVAPALPLDEGKGFDDDLELFG